VDDHLRNHGVLMISPGQVRLTPAFDILPHLEAPNAPQSIGVGVFGCAGTLENALSQCGRFFLDPEEAFDIVREVKAVVADWRKVFREAGASDHDLRMLAACFAFADAAERDVLPLPRLRGRRKP